MPIKIPDDCVKIKMSENGRQLFAVMPSGERIKCVVSIDIHSDCESMVRAVITLIADVSDIPEYDKLITKDIIVQHKVDNGKLLEILNKNKQDLING